MKNILILFCLFYITPIFSQHLHHENCGTPPEKSAWLTEYQARDNNQTPRSDTLIYVALTVHILGDDAGATYPDEIRIMNALCTLNEDFAPSNIQFFVEGGFNYIPNSIWNEHDSYLLGAEMMNTNNVPNTLNCYIVRDPVGNCGYALPAGDAIANSTSCIGPSDHTWAHEIGHHLSLPHPFFGWEGNTYDPSMPTPTEITSTAYTFFQDTIILDTTITITTDVELMDGSNCLTSSDGFCDTAPDYLSSRWPCMADSTSNQSQVDPNGVPFRSDGTLFMSYAFDGCSGRFSDEQIAAMRANLNEERPGYLHNQNPPDAFSDDPIVLTSPTMNQIVDPANTILEWEAIPEATHYIVEVSRLPFFNYIISEGVVNTNSYAVDNLDFDNTYYWRIKPYNYRDFCKDYSETGIFETEVISDINFLTEKESLRIKPNLLSEGHSEINYESDQKLVHLQLLSISGVEFYSKNVTESRGSFIVNFLPKGIYFLKAVSEEGIMYTARFMKQ